MKTIKYLIIKNHLQKTALGLAVLSLLSCQRTAHAPSYASSSPTSQSTPLTQMSSQESYQSYGDSSLGKSKPRMSILYRRAVWDTHSSIRLLSKSEPLLLGLIPETNN